MCVSCGERVVFVARYRCVVFASECTCVRACVLVKSCRIVVVYEFECVSVVTPGRTLPLPLARPHSSRVRSELKTENQKLYE